MRLFQKLWLLGFGVLFDGFSTAETDNTVFASRSGGESFGRADIHFTRVPGTATKYPILGFFSAGWIEHW